MVFEQKVPAKAAELPKCPRNVISDDYRLIPLRRRKFEVIPVLDHDFRGHQSWEDWDLGEICIFVKDSYVKLHVFYRSVYTNVYQNRLLPSTFWDNRVKIV